MNVNHLTCFELVFYTSGLLSRPSHAVGKCAIVCMGNKYICRDARNMARDVQATLLQIVEEHGNKDTSAAAEYIKKLQKRGRYLQDVWS